VEISFAGNQIAAIFGGISRIRHWAHAATVCPIKESQNISGWIEKHLITVPIAFMPN